MKAEYEKKLVANLMEQYELHGKIGAKRKTHTHTRKSSVNY